MQENDGNTSDSSDDGGFDISTQFYIDKGGSNVDPDIKSKVQEALEEWQKCLKDAGRWKELNEPKHIDIEKLNPWDRFAIESGWIEADDINLGKIQLQLLRQGDLKFKTCLSDYIVFQKDKKKINELLATSEILQPEFEKLHTVPMRDMSKLALQKARRKEREKTKGKDWFNLKAPEVTEEVQRDLEVLKMRSVLDPKRFYKKNDIKVLPKYFQLGTVQDSPLDFHSNRLTKKERKQNLVDELMADAKFNKYNKRKYSEIIAENKKTSYKAYQAKKKKNREKNNKKQKIK